jgi:hypothetical protein
MLRLIAADGWLGHNKLGTVLLVPPSSGTSDRVPVLRLALIATARAEDVVRAGGALLSTSTSYEFKHACSLPGGRIYRPPVRNLDLYSYSTTAEALYAR